jgi:4'-phosphopantetheinyl transferase
VPAALDPALQARWLAALPAAQAARVERMHRVSDRAASLLGIALLLDCARTAGLDAPSSRSLVFPGQGKPAWSSGPDFSISHCAGRVGCALAPAETRLGLDIEQRGAATDAALRLVTSSGERSLYAASGLTADDLWTAKEAVLKAAGMAAAQAGEVSLAVDTATLRGRLYFLSRLHVAADSSCTLAATHPAGVTVAEVDAGPLLEGVD